jgi:hypothetical protein
VLVSPVRMATIGSCAASPRCFAELAMPTRGARRLRSTSAAKAFIGEIYRTRQRCSCAGGGENISLLRHHKNAASVLPDPVGAHSNVLSPREIGTQPSDCGRVGAAKTASNQLRTAGLNSARISSGAVEVEAGGRRLLATFYYGRSIARKIERKIAAGCTLKDIAPQICSSLPWRVAALLLLRSSAHRHARSR